MAAQCKGLTLVLLSCLLALASCAPMSPLTSLEDGDEALSKTLNLVQPSQLDARPLKTPLNKDLTPLSDDVHDEEATISYVDASVFRRPADAVKPKTSFFHKKETQNVNKHTKLDKEMRKESLVPSEKLEAPEDEKLFNVEVNNKVAAILSVIHEIVESENKNFAETTKLNEKGSRTTTSYTPTSSKSPESTNEDTTTTQVSPVDLTTSSSAVALINEDSELPRLSPPIWLHSSLAEAMSDPLRLPMIEPYDRYDRYSHSIARDVLW